MTFLLQYAMLYLVDRIKWRGNIMENIPVHVNELLVKLEESGFCGFIVGGSVRDSLLGIKPTDYDLATDARPDEIEKVFSNYKTIDVGKEFGTIIVVQDEGNIEITTLRTEKVYLDGRRPSNVEFTKDIVEDLSRRDFTINAMAYNKNTGIIDPYNGRGDIKKRIIKAVGNPIERFMEDHLRILRAIRFATELDFEINEETSKACRETSKYIENISMERIQVELFRIMLAKKPSTGIRLMEELGVLEYIIPEIRETIDFDQKNPNHDKTVFDHTLCVVDITPPIIQVRLAALFHDIAKPETFTIDEEGIGHFYGHHEIGKEITRKILTRLKASKELITKTETLVKEHMTVHSNMKEKGLKRQINRVGETEIFHLLELQKADRLCSIDGENIDLILDRELEVKKILENKEVYNKNQLKINGKDIINLGYKEGKIIGEILDYLTEEVLEKPELNKKEILIQMVEKIANR